MTETLYLLCAVAGGTLLLCQFLLGLLGFGHDHDTGDDVHADGHDTHGDPGDHDTHGGWFVGVLTFRSMVSAMTIFGLAGLTAGLNLQHEPPVAFAIALVAGGATLFAVAWLMRTLHRLKADGTVRIERAVGANGTVYVTIPGEKAGVGKVTLSLQDRTVEYQAVTPHQQPLPTGAKIVVTAVIGPDTVEVTPATETGSLTHV
jgi:membrane protein implicated in regulation of membrane protease activity